jgi:hypothetical protein
MGGSSKGGSSSGSTKISPLEQSLANISNQMYSQTQPLRSNLLDRYQRVLSGGYDYKTDPVYSALFGTAKQGIESQYNVGRQNIMGSTPTGGALTKALSNLEIARAGDMGTVPANLQNQIASSLFNQATGTAWNSPTQSASMLGQANNTYGMRLMQQQANSANAKGGLGQGIGSLAGSAAGSALPFIFV